MDVIRTELNSLSSFIERITRSSIALEFGKSRQNAKERFDTVDNLPVFSMRSAVPYLEVFDASAEASSLWSTASVTVSNGCLDKAMKNDSDL